MTTWPPATDPFYEDFSDYYVCALWNGIRPDGSGRQHVSFLGTRRAAIGDFALSTPWPDCSEFFHSEDEAKAFLKSQDDLRPVPLGPGWDIVRIADFEARFGYAPISALITIGNDYLAHPQHKNSVQSAGATP